MTREGKGRGIDVDGAQARYPSVYGESRDAQYLVVFGGRSQAHGDDWPCLRRLLARLPTVTKVTTARRDTYGSGGGSYRWWYTVARLTPYRRAATAFGSPAAKSARSAIT